MEHSKEHINTIRSARDIVKRQSASMMARFVICAIMVCLCLPFAGCSDSGAKAEVKNDLEAIKTSSSAGGQLESLRQVVSKEAGKNIDGFLEKVRDFDYEIVSEEESTQDDGKSVVLKVRITTYDFGSEYLAAMNDYMQSEDYKADADEDSREFYDELFVRLSALESKGYTKDVDVIAYCPKGSSEWVTNIKNNEALQDALLGGMPSEMKALSEE